MALIEFSRHVSAPLDRVFSVFTDVANCKERLSGVQDIEMLTEGPACEGTRWRETRVMFGREWSEELWISEFIPNESYTVSCHSCGSEHRSVFTFAADGDGTLVKFSMDCYQLTLFAKVMKVLMKPFEGRMKKAMKEMLETDIEELKAVAEASGGES